MESNWRWNVFEMGLTQLGITLIARSLDDPDLYIVRQVQNGVKYRGVVLGPPDTEHGFIWTGPIGTDPSPFPFGFAVEPDS